MKLKTMMILVLCALLRSNAQDVVLDSTLANKYLAFGSGSVLHDDQVIQTGIDFRWTHLNINMWSSVSPDDRINFGDEVDLGLGWNQKLGTMMGVADVSSDTSAYYFNEPELGKLGKDDMCMFTQKFSTPTKYGNLALNVKNYQTLPGSSYSGGWLIGPSLAQNYPISGKWAVFAKASLNVIHGFGADEGLLANAFISTDYKVNKDLTWSVLQLTPYVPLTAHGRDNDMVIATAITIKLK